VIFIEYAIKVDKLLWISKIFLVWLQEEFNS